MIPRDFKEFVLDTKYRIAELERRARNRRRKGTVAEIGTGDKAGRYKVQLSEQGETPYLSDWIKPRQIAAGDVKIDVLYSQGEQVDVVSESGDLTDAQIDFSTYSDDNQRVNTDSPFHIKIGDTVITASGNTVTITAADIKFVGDVEIEGSVVIEGPVLTHNGKNIGSDHEHIEVVRGGENTGPPE
ncbi:hypothetical protein F4V91_08620 [Neorhizobium galegae]|uniref:Gp5/Type VI secretion system Vgr protein OB-fold domain-containing protein n=1 Tax=Neorhizobium galegae TaxID=399 RepID=A0A6A1TQH9_NEOGA|nr:phage baseplate assembly protein V [Neorhizobium galegae]KAB1086486.1 hypothetical protein F4V91_08620 [Neorhizobium galegae]